VKSSCFNEVQLIIFRLKKLLAHLYILFQNRILVRLITPTPEKLKIFYIGGYWRGPNDMVAQMLHGLRATGVNVIDFNTDKNHDAFETDGRPYDMGTTSPVWLVREKLFPHIFKFCPHVIVCNAGGLSFRPQDAAYLRKLGIKIMGIALSDPAVYKPTTSRIAGNFDVFYSKDIDCVRMYRESGIDAHQLPTATNPSFFRPVLPRDELKCEVLIMGAVHADRIEPVKALVEHFDTHVYGERWEQYGIQSRGFVFGENTLSALSSARMTVVFSRQISGHQALKVGIFDFLSAGCLVVTDENPQIYDYFQVGKEIIVFTDIHDMIAKIRYYLDHSEEAAAICSAGREKVIKNYTWDRVWRKALLKVVSVKGWLM
jgi:spore maturation protein CgeB